LRFFLALSCFLPIGLVSFAQIPRTDSLRRLQDTLPEIVSADTSLRIINLNPYFTIHVDSLLEYDLEINRPAQHYYWYLRNSPVGVRIDRNTGVLYFKADKSFFKSGKLRYDEPYKLELGVQNLYNPSDQVDTSFSILFYSTEVVLSRIKPTTSTSVFVEEGDSIRFRLQCERGTFPIEQITLLTNLPISQYKAVLACNDEFSWVVPFDFIRENDTTRQRLLKMDFIGTDKFMNRDTASVLIYVRPGINYPLKNQEFNKVHDEMFEYIQELKLTFYAVSRTIKTNKSVRVSFDITASTTALAGTILTTTSDNPNTQDIGKILPAVGLTLVPVKEAVAPNKIQEQNTASQIRSTIKRLEYMLSENSLFGERDPDILSKTQKLREELKQARLQLVDLPMVEVDEKITQEGADKYFNDPKVNKKYKLKVN
jgi:hypothetical protein